MFKKNIENKDIVKEVKLDVPPKIIDGSTMVPVRATAGALNAEVSWNQEEQSVDIIMKYDSIADFNDGLAIIYKDKKYGAINEKRELVIPLEYDKISTICGYQNGVMIAEKNGMTGLIDGQNQIVAPFEYEYIIRYQILDGDNTRLRFKKDGKCGLMDNTAKILIQPNYDNIDHYYNNPNIVILEQDKKYGFARLSDRQILQEPFCDSYHKFFPNENLVQTQIWNDGKNLSGLVSEDGVKLACVYELIVKDHYNETVIKIVKDGKYGTIDINGNIIINPIYDLLSGFKINKDVMDYKLNGKSGLINTSGKVLT